jgi:signal transduction histidine kinase/DNA-binding NarL/FixJ family response regulator
MIIYSALKNLGLKIIMGLSFINLFENIRVISLDFPRFIQHKHVLRRFIYIIFIISFAGVLPAQTVNVDSLRQIARDNSLDEKTRTYAYVPIITYYRQTNHDSLKHYMKELLDFAKESNYLIAYHKYHYSLAGYYGLFLTPGEDAYSFIQKNYLEAKRYAELGNRLGLVSLCYARLVPENFRFGKEELALQYCIEGEKVAIESGYYEDLAYFYGQRGKIYHLGYGDTDTALRYLFKSDSVYASLPKKEKSWGFTLSFIGDVYQSLEDYEKDEVYQLKALDIFTEANDKYQQVYIKGKLAQIQKLKGNYNEAISLINEAVDYHKERQNPLQVAGFLVVQSSIYSASGQYQKALQAGKEAIELNKELKSKLGTILALVNQSEILSKLKRYSESNALAKEAEALAIEQNSFEELNRIYEVLVDNSKNENNYEQAFKFTQDLQRVNDTLTQRRNLKITKDLEAKYQTEQKEKEIALLKSENELAESRRKNQKILLWSIVGFSIIALSSLFVLNRNRQRTNRKLKELDLAKTTFFQNISHEFKTPLSLILGTLEKQHLSASNTDEKKDLEVMQRNADRLHDLVNQILDLSKLEANQWQLQVSETNIKSLLKSITASFEFKAREKHIDYSIAIDDLENGWFDVDAIEKIVTNLLSNAFKYTKENEKVGLKASQNNNRLILKVSNTGQHFTSAEIASMFDRFSRLEVHSHSAGTGIGLALVKQLVTLAKGDINVSQSDAKTITFEVILPYDKGSFQSHEIVTNNAIEERESSPISNEDFQPTDGKPILLVVDDNADIRIFIKEAFETHYTIIEAQDGETGLQLALETVPDIVVSDIMMPKLSGIEFCKMLKQDERISHIPIVLLTAKGDVETEFQGLETGADDYILKPFKLKLLKSRINNLVNSRIALRERYSMEVVLKPKDISLNSADQRFFERIEEILDNNISNETFSSEDFSKAIGMSRMQLHRKLKALTGLSTSEYLRTERLKVASVLLKDKSLNISEIGYQVGFSSPSYFSKCFKETYGMLPSEFRDKS